MKVLKCDAGERWRISVGADRVTIEEILRRFKEERIIPHTLEDRPITYNVTLRRVMQPCRGGKAISITYRVIKKSLCTS
jgi:hypothetical protein